GIPGTGTGDSQADNVIVNGTAGNDNISVSGNATGATVDGLAARVNATGADVLIDRVTVNGLDGDDVVEPSDFRQTGGIHVTVEGGNGSDTVLVNGSNNADTFAIFADGTHVAVNEVPALVNVDIGSTETVVVNGNGGDDTISAGNGLATLTQLVLDGGAGND